MGRHLIGLTATLSVAMMLVGCSKHEPHSSSPASVLEESAVADQSASIWSDPSTIQRGGSASLTWRTTNTTEVSIDGVGAVPTNGSVTVSPAASTIYHLTAKGAGKTLDVTAQLTVKLSPPR